MSIAATSDPRRPGRRRDEDLTRRVLLAALDLLRSEGYDAVTIEGVARAAGVSRPAVYARWPHLADLLFDATVLARRAAPAVAGDDAVVAPDTGSLQGDLDALVADGDAILDVLDRTGVLRGLLADAIRHPRLGRRLTEELLEPDEARYRAIFERAADRGELTPDPDRDALVPQLLLGFALVQRLVAGRPPDAATLQRAAGLLGAGLRAERP